MCDPVWAPYPCGPIYSQNIGVIVRPAAVTQPETAKTIITAYGSPEKLPI